MVNFPRNNCLLQIAAGEHPCHRAKVGIPDAVFFKLRLCHRRRFFILNRVRRCIGRVIKPAHQEVIQQRGCQRRAGRLPVLRDMRHSGLSPAQRRIVRSKVFPVYRHRTGVIVSDTGNCLNEFCLAVALHTGNADDFSLPHAK